MKKSIEQVLKEQGKVVITATGVSMLPCIRPQKDVLILEVPKKKIKCYDILLYKRENGMLVLHRVLQAQNGSYSLCGDHQYILEDEVKEAQILAILKGFYRGKRYIDCENNRWYQWYIRFWCSSLTFRKGLIKGKNIWKTYTEIIRTYFKRMEKKAGE